MKRRFIAALMMAGAVSGCLNIDGTPETGGMKPHYGRSFGPPSVPGVMGPYGESVPMAAPYSMAPPASEYQARMMMSQNQPMNRIQMNAPGAPMTGPGGMNMPQVPMPPGGILSPPGVPFAPGAAPGGGLMKTAAMGPGLDRGVVNANMPPSVRAPGGDVKLAQFANSSPVGSLFPAQRTQVFFTKPAGMKVYWFTQGPDGKPNYSTTPLETPGRYNFAQSAIYRLKLTHIPGRPALELYPTLEVVPTSPKTNEFLAHNSVPVEFTEKDFKDVVDRNYIVKVIYLPDPQFQDAAGAGPDELVSTQLDPGQDPIQEALRRGSILLVLRIGNIDQGLQHSPPTNAPIPGGPPALTKPPGMGVQPFMQVPFPVNPVVPGTPNPLPPGVAPKMPEAPNGKTEELPQPRPLEKKTEVEKKDPNKISVPALNLPMPPGFKLDLPPNVPAPPGNVPPATETPAVPPLPIPGVPPIPNPAEKSSSNVPARPETPVIPASKTIPSPVAPLPTPAVTLPAAVEPTTPGRPDLPAIPMLPAPKQ